MSYFEVLSYVQLGQRHLRVEKEMVSWRSPMNTLSETAQTKRTDGMAGLCQMIAFIKRGRRGFWKWK
jgi:hypothetical protein